MVIKFETLGEPYPRTCPESYEVGKDGQRSYKWNPKVIAYSRRLREDADRAMSREPSLLSGELSIGLVIHWPHPAEHSNDRGVLKTSARLSSPIKWPTVPGLLDVVMNACKGVVYHSDKQIVNVHRLKKIWDDTGGPGKIEVEIKRTSPKELDPSLCDIPEQQELGI